MKFLVSIVLCCLVVATLADELPEAVKEKLKAANKKCQENPDTAIDEVALEAWKKGGRDASQRPANLGSHALCIAKILDWMTEDGNPNREGLKAKMTHRITDSAKVEEILNKCAAKQETPEATALLMVKCLVSSH